MSTYSEQIEDMILRGVARKLTSEGINTYDGPIHYIVHHAVIKPDSKSTPVRIVFDSSHSDKGHSLNSYWAKGPDGYMNNLLSVLLKFRENRIGIVGDIKKMYNSVYIKELDQHVHRFLWRNMDTNKTPDIYVITAVNIGDRPSGTIATVALRKTAIMGSKVYPKAAEIVLESTYVDDIVNSVSSKDEADSITKDICSLLQPGNFHIKGWNISGETDSALNLCDNNIDEKVLGLSWHPELDLIKFKVKLNFSKKIKNLRTEPDLKEPDLPSRIPQILT